MAAILEVYPGCDMNVNYNKARNAATKAYLNSGNCTYEFKDCDGNILASGTCNYQTASNGWYLGVIDKTITLGLVIGNKYFLEITFTSGDFDDFRRDEVLCKYRP